MSLYRMELDDEFGEPYYVEVTTGQIVAWLREQGAVDYEALIGEVGLRLLRRVRAGETITPERATTEMLNVFDAALPPTGEIPNV